MEVRDAGARRFVAGARRRARVYVGSSDGKLYVLEAATGRKTWEFDAGDAITASPAVAAGRVVVGAQDGRIYCFG